MNARVFITGGAGYLGSILCEHLLDAGHRVTVLDNLMHRQTSLAHRCANPDFQFEFGDARDQGMMRRPYRPFCGHEPFATWQSSPRSRPH